MDNPPQNRINIWNLYELGQFILDLLCEHDQVFEKQKIQESLDAIIIGLLLRYWIIIKLEAELSDSVASAQVTFGLNAHRNEKKRVIESTESQFWVSY